MFTADIPSDFSLMDLCDFDDEWYLKKELAIQIDDKTIQLNFQPSTKRHSMDTFYQSPKENR